MIACQQRSPTLRTASESSRRRTQRNLARASNDQGNSAGFRATALRGVLWPDYCRQSAIDSDIEVP
jgi:hypothetical protein